jgi:3-oxoacyl-[acyl-carrier protein] reductase
MEKVALITGSSRGIGLAIAERLASDGFSVVLSGLPNDPDLEQAAKRLISLGGTVLAIAADVTKDLEVSQLFEQIQSEFGGLDVVVHNAGFMQPASISSAASTVESFDRTIRINLRGTFLVLAQAAKYVREHGRIEVMSSSVLDRPGSGYAAYLSSKASIEGLVRVLANELRGRNINVNAIAPGPIATEFFLKWKSPEEVEAIKLLSPFERLGTPEDVASLASFLSGPDGRWIHGQSVRTNGGFA